MSKTYMKKKDIFVIAVNILVLILVVYIYYVIEQLKKTLLSESVCILKPSSNIDLNSESIAVFDDSMLTSQNVVIRHSRSTQSKKFQNSFLFTLAQSNIDFEQNGILGPWILSNKSLSVDTYIPIKLTSRRTLFEIVNEGNYLIYIQVYYLSSSMRNSFTMTKKTVNANETLSVCSSMGVHGTEISCFTSIVEYFKTGESFFVRLREMSSNINLNRRGSHTYLGLLKLS